MSVLLEAINIVVTNPALERHYPGGVMGFARDCPNASFCSDGRISRVGFLGQRETAFFLGVLAACGLACPAGPGVAAGDAVVVDQNTGPVQPCLWLECGQSEEGVAICWHAGHRPGRLYVPFNWESDRAAAFRATPGIPFRRRL